MGGLAVTSDHVHNTLGTQGVFSGPLGAKFVDIHCHCLAGMDDGPATQAEAIALCRKLVDDDVNTVVATPHQLGRFSQCNDGRHIRYETDVLNDLMRSHNIPLRVLPGGDVRVDERICELLAAKEVLTLADAGRYVLLELPHEIFIDIEPLLVELSAIGIEAVISHPERHLSLAKKPSRLIPWLSHSAHLQVTAGSLLGQFGPVAERTAWQLLISGWASVVASDAHGADFRAPCMKPAFAKICAKIDWDTAYLTCVENPLRVVQGHDICPIHSAEVRSVVHGGTRSGKQ